MDIKLHELWVRLLNEGTEVFIITKGYEIAKDIYIILITDKYNPEDQEWEFPPGTVTTCIHEYHSGKERLIANEKIMIR